MKIINIKSFNTLKIGYNKSILPRIYLKKRYIESNSYYKNKNYNSHVNKK